MSPRDELADAAALIVAEAKGDTDAGRLLLDALVETGDTRAALVLARSLLTVAGLAVRAEARHAFDEQGSVTPPGLSYLVTLSEVSARFGGEGR